MIGSVPRSRGAIVVLALAALAASARPGRADEVRATSELYLHHYLHALPFDRAVLAKTWSRCRDEPCERLRAEIEAQLGPIDGAGRR